jgi:hypothetical protein
MIVSASFRTDIPAFYGQWFENRLRAGYCLAPNPYSGTPYRVSLLPGEAEGIVFWTKNLGPFQSRLNAVHEREIPFVVHYTITGYPRELETSVARADKAIEHLRRVADTYGPLSAVWRYDPIVFTSMTDADYHRRNFEKIAKGLEGVTDEVNVSFAQLYKKTLVNTKAAAALHGFSWWDPPDEFKREFAQELAQVARNRGIRLRMCAQRQHLAPGVEDACCIDAGRLARIGGRPVEGKKPGHRGKECGCHQSRDIGDYDTCAHGCVYCYAVRDPAIAKKRRRTHDSGSEYLIMPTGMPAPPKTAAKKAATRQGDLFE